MNIPQMHTRLRRLLLAGLSAAAVLCAACRPVARPSRATPSAAPSAAPAREVRLTRELSLAGVALAVEIRERVGGGAATGAMRVTTGNVGRASVERDFDCRARARDERRTSWECAVPFRRRAPDWAAVLSRLDALGVMAPPPGPDAPSADAGGRRLVHVCNDGAPWTLEVRVGGSTTVRDEQACGPIDARRAAFEAGIDSVLDAVTDAGRIR